MHESIHIIFTVDMSQKYTGHRHIALAVYNTTNLTIFACDFMYKYTVSAAYFRKHVTKSWKHTYNHFSDYFQVYQCQSSLPVSARFISVSNYP